MSIEATAIEFVAATKKRAQARSHLSALRKKWIADNDTFFDKSESDGMEGHTDMMDALHDREVANAEYRRAKSRLFRACTAGVIVGGESNTDDVPERLKGDALRSSRETGCKQEGPVARAADTGSFVGSNPTVVHSVDWLGLALDLEAQAKRVESQTAERAMLAGAHGLRLMGADGVIACSFPYCNCPPDAEGDVHCPSGVAGTEAPSWVRLADSDWVNIVNAPSVLDPMKDKEEAVREAVKLTEEKLRLLNVGPWCCEKGRAAGVEVCRECAEESAGYLAAMSPRGVMALSPSLNEGKAKENGND